MLTAVRTGPRPVAVTRILVGLAALYCTLEGAAYVGVLRDDRILVPVAGWLPGPADVPIGLWASVMAVAALALTFGVLTPVAAAGAGIGHAALMLVDQQIYSNHRFLLVLLCLALVPAAADRALSPLAARRRAQHGDTVPWWPQLLLLATVSSCYVFAGLSKVNPVFLSGSQVDELRWFDVPDPIAMGIAAGAVATEIAIGVGLWFARTRVLAVALGILLHVSIVALLATPVVFTAFALMCVSVYPLAFVRARWPAA